MLTTMFCFYFGVGYVCFTGKVVSFVNFHHYIRTGSMTISIEKKEFFKTCPMCNTRWDSLNSFLADPLIFFNGYQANFGILDEGLFYFTHDTPTCGSTMGIKVRIFSSLFSGERFINNKQLSKDCPLYCLDRNNLNRCDAQCENAYAREISQIIKDRTTSIHREPALHHLQNK